MQGQIRQYESDLGDIISSLGMTDLTMADGKKITLKTTYYGSVAQERISAIRKYLAAKGNDAILKPQKIKVSDKDVANLPEELQERVEYNIHHSTLRSFLTELDGKDELDSEAMDLFKVHLENTVNIK